MAIANIIKQKRRRRLRARLTKGSTERNVRIVYLDASKRCKQDFKKSDRAAGCGHLVTTCDLPTTKSCEGKLRGTGGAAGIEPLK